MFTSYNYTQAEIFRNMSEAERSRIAVVKGHVPFGLHTSFSKPATYLTFLRDPVKRCISEYHHIYRDPYFKELAAKNYSLKEMLTGGHHRNLDNCQVRFLAAANALPFGEVNEATYETAIKNFDEHFKIFGLSERFDESILYVSRKLHWSWPFYVSANLRRQKEVQFDAETMELLRRQNRYDIALYEHARRRFDEMISREGEEFQRELKRFVRINTMQAPLRKFIRRIWQQLAGIPKN